MIKLVNKKMKIIYLPSKIKINIFIILKNKMVIIKKKINKINKYNNNNYNNNYNNFNNSSNNYIYNNNKINKFQIK